MKLGLELTSDMKEVREEEFGREGMDEWYREAAAARTLLALPIVVVVVGGGDVDGGRDGGC